MNLIEKIKRNLKKYDANKLKIVGVRKIASVKYSNDGVKIRYKNLPHYYIASYLKDYSTYDIFKYELLTQNNKILDLKPENMCIAGEEVVTEVYPLKNICKLSLEDVSALETEINNKPNQVLHFVQKP